MAPLQHRFLGQADFARQVRAGLALQHATHEQDHVDGGKLAPGEAGPAIEVVNPLTPVTAPDGQAAPTIDAKEAGVGARRVAVRALLAGGMEVLLQPRDALLVSRRSMIGKSMP